MFSLKNLYVIFNWRRSGVDTNSKQILVNIAHIFVVDFVVPLFILGTSNKQREIAFKFSF